MEVLPLTKFEDRPAGTGAALGTAGMPIGRPKYSPRSVIAQVAASDVVPPEPGKITTYLVVDHLFCGRRHVHLVRRAGSVTSVIRRPPCGGARYRIVFAGTTVPLPRPEVVS